MRRYPTPTGTARRQRGVVLAMSLIFLAILSLVGLYAMRGSIQGEQVSKNLSPVKSPLRPPKPLCVSAKTACAPASR